MNLGKTIIAVIIVFYSSAYSQDKYDYQWIFGSNPNGSLLDFNSESPTVSHITKMTWMGVTNNSMCDSSGNLLFYTNGCNISGADHQIIQNGDTINSGILYDHGYCNSGSIPLVMGAISIPAPWDQNTYLLFNLNLDTIFYEGSFPPTPRKLYCQVIRWDSDSNKCSVIEKRKVIISDTLNICGLKAVRHSNERDWWILVSKSLTNCYHVLLVDSSGIHESKLNCGGPVIRLTDCIVPIFSPNGSKYLHFIRNIGINIFEFDNATGSMEFIETVDMDETMKVSNTRISVSPNSKYAYFAVNTTLYQMDLEADDRAESIVPVAELQIDGVPFTPNFNLSALGPDGKIYLIGSGNSKFLHVIHYPDCPGVYCTVEQRAITLPYSSFKSIPNLPHFRNQPSGVNCDSIATNTQNIVKQGHAAYSIHPVPASDVVKFERKGGHKTEVIASIVDLMGKRVLVSAAFLDMVEVQVGHLPPGLYMYIINAISDHKSIDSGKLLIVK